MKLVEHALHYGTLGLRVFPLVWHGMDPEKVAGTPLVKWTRDASSDAGQIRRWWSKWPEAGIGLACGDELSDGTFLFVLDVDEHDPAHSGSEALAELVEANGELPEGPLVLTAGGGTHRYLRSTTRITNARGSLPPGIDVRGAGGYVVLPPSSHKSGGRHEWEVEQTLAEVPIPEAPSWLLDVLLAAPERMSEPAAPKSNDRSGSLWENAPDDRPGTGWAERTTWNELLEADGWQFFGLGDDHELWTRPGKDPKEGPSATVNYGGADRLVVHSTNANVPPDSYSKLGYLTAAHYGGDFHAAAKAIAPEKPLPSPPANVDPVTGEILPEHELDDAGELSEDDDWKPIDVADIARKILRGEYEPELPQILEVADSLPLLYPGRSHTLFGPPGGGKTWVGLEAVAETLKRGEWVLMIDFEDSAHGTAQRLVRLGCTVEELERFDYRSVATSLAYGWTTLEASTVDYSLVVIDSTGEALAAQGINPNDDGEVAGWMTFVKRLSRRESSPAVLLLDHVPKSSENPHGAPIGSQRKLAAVTGAAYRCDTITEPARGKPGKFKLVVAKDRLGHRAKGATAAMVDIEDTVDDGIALTFHLTDAQIAAKEGKPFRPTGLMERVSEYVTENPGKSKNEVEKNVKGGAGHLRQALDRLVEEGYVRRTEIPGTNGTAHYTENVFFEDEDTFDEEWSRTVADPVDNLSGSDTSSPSSTLVPPLVY